MAQKLRLHVSKELNASMTRWDYVRTLSPPRRFLYWSSWALPVVIAWCGFLIWFNAGYTIAINRSSSLEGSIYLIKKSGRVPERGALVAFIPGPTPAYPWSVIYVKRIGGVPGDIISLRDRTFAINGVVTAVAKSVSKLGKPMAVGPTGVLPSNHYWVYTESPDSYDSRYRDIGWVSKNKIIGPAYVLL